MKVKGKIGIGERPHCTRVMSSGKYPEDFLPLGDRYPPTIGIMKVKARKLSTGVVHSHSIQQMFIKYI